MGRVLGFVLALGLIGHGAAGAQVAGGQASPYPLTGLVTAAGAPQAGAAVRAFAPGESQPAASATTAADGKYQLTLPRGVYRVEFSLTGFETVTRFGIVVLPDATNVLDVQFRRAASATPAARPSTPLQPGEVAVDLETPFGTIVIAIDTVRAPITAQNFLKYVDGGFYDSGRFHRATRQDNYTPAPPNRPMMELIQGGINPERRAQAFPAIPLERTSVTGLKHVAGTVSMARGTAADTATSDFFILLDDQPSLDFGGKRFDDGQGGAAFGRVVSGLDVVRKVQQQPVTGQNLTPPVPIIKAKRK